MPWSAISREQLLAIGEVAVRRVVRDAPAEPPRGARPRPGPLARQLAPPSPPAPPAGCRGGSRVVTRPIVAQMLTLSTFVAHSLMLTPPTSRGPPRRTSCRKAGDPRAVCVAVLAINLDTTIVNVALPSLARELDAGTRDLLWIVDGYNLAFAALVLAAGSLSDRFGRRPALIARPARLRRRAARSARSSTRSAP